MNAQPQGNTTPGYQEQRIQAASRAPKPVIAPDPPAPPRPRGRKALAATRSPSAAEVEQTVAAAGPPLLDGHRLTCPGCENTADILAYIPLQHSEKYADQIIVPLVCRRCRHTFALRPGIGDV